MNVYDVILSNETNDADLLYDVAAPSERAAIVEAWRQYRELPYVDGEFPPAWAAPRVGLATYRKDGERPYYTGFTFANAQHITRF